MTGMSMRSVSTTENCGGLRKPVEAYWHRRPSRSGKSSSDLLITRFTPSMPVRETWFGSNRSAQKYIHLRQSTITLFLSGRADGQYSPSTPKRGESSGERQQTALSMLRPSSRETPFTSDRSTRHCMPSTPQAGSFSGSINQRGGLRPCPWRPGIASSCSRRTVLSWHSNTRVPHEIDLIDPGAALFSPCFLLYSRYDPAGGYGRNLARANALS